MYQNQELNSDLLKNVFFPAYFVFGGQYLRRETVMGANCKIFLNFLIIRNKS